MELIQLLHRPHKQRNPVLTYQYITKTIKKYKNLDFIQLDKNNGTWAISCRAYYRQLHCEYFDNDPHYEFINTPSLQIREKIEERYEDLELSTLALPRKNWLLGQTKLLPKDKYIFKQ